MEKKRKERENIRQRRGSTILCQRVSWCIDWTQRRSWLQRNAAINMVWSWAEETSAFEKILGESGTGVGTSLLVSICVLLIFVSSFILSLSCVVIIKI